jgi:uncharacterized protein
MLLTDDLLLNYKRCSRRAFLNVHGNQAEKQPEKDFRVKLKQESENHCQAILEQFYPVYHQPQTSQDDLGKRAQETEALMKQGVDCIYQGTLHYRNDENINCFASPTLLVKQNIASQWAKWSYYPVSIQLGSRPKPEYKIISGFYGYILGKIQGLTPTTATLILRYQNTYKVNLQIWIHRTLEVMGECLSMLTQKIEPEVFISRQRCNLCQWYGNCYGIAKSRRHLSLVPGITPKRYEYLQKKGISSLESLRDLSITEITPFIDPEIAINLQKQAQSILENTPILKSKQISKIPSAKIELYFDIEAEPNRNIDYLLGILLVDRSNNQQKYYPFLAETLSEEKSIWQNFLLFVNKYTKAPIFHYSNYEVETLKRLAKLYQTPASIMEPLLLRLIDLHQKVLTSLILPTENYSLKSVANWLGFYWRNPFNGDQLFDRSLISGDQCVCWYDQWLKTGDRYWLKCILRYNEDDCLATYHLKNWLDKYLQQTQIIFTESNKN